MKILRHATKKQQQVWTFQFIDSLHSRQFAAIHAYTQSRAHNHRLEVIRINSEAVCLSDYYSCRLPEAAAHNTSFARRKSITTLIEISTILFAFILLQIIRIAIFQTRQLLCSLVATNKCQFHCWRVIYSTIRQQVRNNIDFIKIHTNIFTFLFNFQFVSDKFKPWEPN